MLVAGSVTISISISIDVQITSAQSTPSTSLIKSGQVMARRNEIGVDTPARVRASAAL